MSNKMHALTVRFTSAEMERISKIAKQIRKSKAEIIRSIVTHNELKYSYNFVNITEGQYMQIREVCYEILTELQKIKTELHRIGINYNQSVRRQNATAVNTYTRLKYQLENELPKDEVQGLMDQLVKASERIGEALCRIVV